MGLAQAKKAYVAAHKGSIARNVPRIINVDKGIQIVGYIDVNQLATSIMGRVKTHKGFFYCDTSDVEDGDLILDRQDNRHYLVMLAKNEVFNWETIYMDCTLFYCDALITVQRFSSGTRDGFGRPTVPTPQNIATNVRCMAQSLNFDVLEQEDRLIAHDKVKFYVQQKVGIKVADRLINASGDRFIVQSVDMTSLNSFSICSVDTDVR